MPPADPSGAEICKDSAVGNRCYDIGRAQADRLAAALATGRLQQETGECSASPVAIYPMAFQPASGLVDPVVWTVPSADCLPMAAGGDTYDLPDDARDAVARIWAGAGRSAAPADTAAAAVVERCLTGLTATPVPGLVGKTEQEAFPPNARSALRVLARDGECTGDGLAGDGITHVVLAGGRVVWAGRLDDPQDGPVPGPATPVPTWRGGTTAPSARASRCSGSPAEARSGASRPARTPPFARCGPSASRSSASPPTRARSRRASRQNRRREEHPSLGSSADLQGLDRSRGRGTPPTLVDAGPGAPSSMHHWAAAVGRGSRGD